ncbi:MAG: hypothetical protein QM784_40230 [Polyangiaceae bacterium]
MRQSTRFEGPTKQRRSAGYPQRPNTVSLAVRWTSPIALVAFAGLCIDTSGCASHSNGTPGQAGAGGDGGAETTETRASKGGRSSTGGTSARSASSSGGTSATSSTSENGGLGGAQTTVGGTASTSTTTPSCIPSTGLDKPDLEGKDTNCDGIDGTQSQSVFVSPDGLDSRAGTKEDPVRSIGKAVELAKKSNGKLTDVLVCAGTYVENVIVTDSAVNLHGGYDCSSWVRTTVKPLIAPASGVPLRIANVQDPIELSRFSIKAPDATAPGESSQALQVVKSLGVHVSQSIIAAGRGAPGANGKLQTQGWAGTRPMSAAKGEAVQVGTDGSIGCHSSNYGSDVDFDGKADSGPDQALGRCTTARTGGTSGGRFCVANGNQYPVQGGKGGTATMKPLGAIPVVSTDGARGVPATAPTSLSPGAPGKGFGVVSEDGYVANNAGADGSDGLPGMSGNGGYGGGACLVRQGNIDLIDPLIPGSNEIRAGSTCLETTEWGTEPWVDASRTYAGRMVTMFPGSGGGQGGYGGCGGFKGFGGGAGGASIAILSLASALTLEWTDISTADGGNGGNPSDGSDGQLGGEGGAGGDVVSGGITLPTVNGRALVPEGALKGGKGSNGLAGQKGSAGGPGGGGPSIGILWQGTTEPSLDGTVTIKAGNGGKGGTPVAGNPGADGVSAPRYNPVAP